MVQKNGAEALSEDQRKEIFLALVDAQDHEMAVTQSRSLIAQRFDVSENQVRQIEREGLDVQVERVGGHAAAHEPSATKKLTLIHISRIERLGSGDPATTLT